MKRIYICMLTTVMTFLAFKVSAQTENTEDRVKSYLGFYGGVSSPMGDFKSTNYDNNKAGFAKNGVAFGLDGAFYFYKHLALGATLSFQDQGELHTSDATNLANGYTASFSADGATVTAVKRFHSANLLAGPQYTFLISKSLSLDVRASAGVIHSFSTPEITTALVGSATQTATFYQRSVKESVFGYGGNLGLNYALSDHINLTLRGAYVGSSGYSITNDDRTVTTTGRYVTKLPVSEIQTTLGLNFGF